MDEQVSAGRDKVSIPVHMSNVSSFERHAQTILAVLIVALISWDLSTTQDTVERMIAVEVKLTNLHDTVKDIKTVGYSAVQGEVLERKIILMDGLMQRVTERVDRIASSPIHMSEKP
jgi:hypothetical protein